MMGRLSRLSRAAARQRAAELIEQFELTAAAGGGWAPTRAGCAAGSTSPPAWSAVRR